MLHRYVLGPNPFKKYLLCHVHKFMDTLLWYCILCFLYNGPNNVSLWMEKHIELTMKFNIELFLIDISHALPCISREFEKRWGRFGGSWRFSLLCSQVSHFFYKCTGTVQLAFSDTSFTLNAINSKCHFRKMYDWYYLFPRGFRALTAICDLLFGSVIYSAIQK